ncbi:MAG: hypothetical protein QOE41_4613 [Mycobacterium sp.]|jgi:hypothetical protein|nr:hypothetical protein [Mycobacterium sp.]
MMSPEPMAPYALAGLVIRDFCKELRGLACDQLAEVGGAAQSPVPLHEGEDLLQCLADRGELALHVGLKKGIVGRLELLRLPCRSWCSVIPLIKRGAAASRQSNRRQPRDTQDERVGNFPTFINGNLTHRHDESGTMRESCYRDGDIGVEA